MSSMYVEAFGFMLRSFRIFDVQTFEDQNSTWSERPMV
jgi:hypothetical protein